MAPQHSPSDGANLLPTRTLRHSSPAPGEEQKIDRTLSKYTVTARMANGQLTTTTLHSGPQNSCSAQTLQIESTRQLKTPPGICSPSVVGILSGGGVNASLSAGRNSPATGLGTQSEVEDVDPDVIPNQYGSRLQLIIPSHPITHSASLSQEDVALSKYLLPWHCSTPPQLATRHETQTID